MFLCCKHITHCVHTAHSITNHSLHLVHTLSLSLHAQLPRNTSLIHTHSHTFTHSHSLPLYDTPYPHTHTHTHTPPRLHSISYADLLSRWKLRTACVSVLTALRAPHRYPCSSELSTGLGMGVYCRSCRWRLTDALVCRECDAFGFRCIVCRVAVRGLTAACMRCGHGGHPHHLREWFRENVTCPTGCGCECQTTLLESKQ
jgi:RING/Ubox like zinc-binding domain